MKVIIVTDTCLRENGNHLRKELRRFEGSQCEQVQKFIDDNGRIIISVRTDRHAEKPSKTWYLKEQINSHSPYEYSPNELEEIITYVVRDVSDCNHTVEGMVRCSQCDGLDDWAGHPSANPSARDESPEYNRGRKQ